MQMLRDSELFEKEFENSDIRYELVATVNGEVAGKISDYDPQVIASKIDVLEGEVAQLVQSNIQSNADYLEEFYAV